MLPLRPTTIITEESFKTVGSSELMTPLFESQKYQPLSRVSLASLEDLGYVVNMSAADPLHIQNYQNVRKLQNGNVDDIDIDFDDDDDGDYDDNEDVDSNDLFVMMNKPSKTFVLDSTNMIRPAIHGHV